MSLPLRVQEQLNLQHPAELVVVTNLKVNKARLKGYYFSRVNVCFHFNNDSSFKCGNIWHSTVCITERSKCVIFPTAVVVFLNNGDFCFDYKVYFRFIFILTLLQLNDTDFQVKKSLYFETE